MTLLVSSDFDCTLSVSAIHFDSFGLAKMVGYGEVGGHIQDMLCTRQLPWLAVEWPWSALAGPFLNWLAQIGVKPLFFPCRGTISGSYCKPSKVR